MNIIKGRGSTHIINVVIILAVCLAAYANSFGNEFVYDDQHIIVRNPYIRDLKTAGRLFFREFFPGGQAFNYYRPLTSILNAVDYAIWKLDPFGYHLTNFILHFISCCLVYALLFYLFGSPLMALLLGLVFASHPAATEAITYMPSRSDPLVFIFLIIAFALFDKGLKGGLAVYALACLSKETAVVFPAFLLAYALIKNRAWKPVMPYFAVAAAYLAARWLVLRANGALFFEYAPESAHVDMATRLISAPAIILRYVRAFFIPSTFVMDEPAILYNHILNPAALFSWAALLLAAAAAMRFRRSAWVTGLLWFLAFIFPVSGILSINSFFYHHWLYIPSLGILITLAAIPARFRRVIFVWAAVMTALCLALTIKQNRHYKNELTLYREILSKFPNSDRVHYNLGAAYLGRGLTEEAIQEFKEALRARPDYVEAYVNLGYAYSRKGQANDAEAAFAKAISIAPARYLGYYYMGNFYNDTGRPKEAIGCYKKAIGLRRNDAEIYFDLGRAFDKIGGNEETIRAYRKALELDPANMDAYLNLGAVYAQRGDYAEARNIWGKGLKINPAEPAIKRNLEKLDRMR
jgi:tetratricopeptide (TPR) repeat protein